MFEQFKISFNAVVEFINSKDHGNGKSYLEIFLKAISETYNKPANHRIILEEIYEKCPEMIEVNLQLLDVILMVAGVFPRSNSSKSFHEALGEQDSAIQMIVNHYGDFIQIDDSDVMTLGGNLIHPE